MFHSTKKIELVVCILVNGVSLISTIFISNTYSHLNVYLQALLSIEILFKDKANTFFNCHRFMSGRFS